MVDKLINSPTWQTPIRSFFNDIDIAHMLKVSEENGIDPVIDLSDYNSVVTNKIKIQKKITTKRMPIPPSPPWSDDFIAIFNTWITNGCPES